MNRTTRIASILIAAVLALTVAACGGGSGNSSASNSNGSSSSSSSGGQLSKADFKQQFVPIDDNIKAAGRTLGQAIVKAEHGQVTDKQLEDIFKGIHEQLSTNLDKLAALKPPTSLQSDVQSYISSLRPVDADVQKAIDALQTTNHSEARAAGSQLVQDSAKVKPIANSLRQKLGVPTS